MTRLYCGDGLLEGEQEPTADHVRQVGEAALAHVGLNVAHAKPLWDKIRLFEQEYVEFEVLVVGRLRIEAHIVVAVVIVHWNLSNRYEMPSLITRPWFRW